MTTMTSLNPYSTGNEVVARNVNIPVELTLDES